MSLAQRHRFFGAGRYGSGRRYGQIVPSDPLASVTRDASSLIYCPANASEMAALCAAAGWGPLANAPLVYTCQVAAGNLVEAGGGPDLVASGAVGYSAAVSGWSRFAVTIPVALSAGFMAAAGIGPNPSTTSVLWIWWLDVTATGGARNVCSAGGGSTPAELIAQLANVSHALSVKCLGNTTAGASDAQAGGARPFALHYNRAGSAVAAYDDLEQVNGIYGAGVTDGPKGIGDGRGSVPAAGMSALWGACIYGTDAERPPAQVKNLLSTAGWPLSY